jgi:hypothetical protein
MKVIGTRNIAVNAGSSGRVTGLKGLRKVNETTTPYFSAGDIFQTGFFMDLGVALLFITLLLAFFIFVRDFLVWLFSGSTTFLEMICPKCGLEFFEEDKFCMECGDKRH